MLCARLSDARDGSGRGAAEPLPGSPRRDRPDKANNSYNSESSGELVDCLQIVTSAYEDRARHDIGSNGLFGDGLGELLDRR